MSPYPVVIECPEVYPPSEDTLLTLEVIRIQKGEKMLDVGTGTGILGIHAALSGARVTASDVSEKALECAKRNASRNGVEMEFILSDLFDAIKGVFDVVLFNPPYLPEEEWSKRDAGDNQWDGGGDGSETIKRFLSGLPSHLRGRCYLLFSSLTGKGRETVDSLLKDRFSFVLRGEKRLFFETLYVYEIWKQE